jgi:L-fucose isomerase-like protein
MYLAMKDLMDRYQAQAIAINCLEGHKTGGLKAYPCLGFSELNNGDQVGVCEGDLNSAITMLTMRHLINRPGYISDPVIDTSKNQVIYAHCVAPQKVFGPEGPVNPYRIRSHAEDNNGAAVQSMMPLGYMTTTIEFFLNRRELSIHQGKTVANIDIDKACRSKLAVDLKGDMEKLLRADWDRGGWHRVTFYGDVADPIREVCRQLKIPVVPEA